MTIKSGIPTELPLQLRPNRPAAIEVDYGSGGDFANGSIIEDGNSGLQLAGEKQYAVGTELELRFGRNSKQASGVITMKAVVRRIHPGPMHVAFVSVRPSDQAKTLGTIRQLTAAQRK